MIIGGSGLLGSAVVEAAERRGWEVLAPTRDELDVTDETSIANYVPCASPYWIVNCAAYTAVDKAETDREAAFLLNGVAPGFLGRAARESRARIIHISSDFVFDGKANGRYREYDPTNPLGVYGESKLQGERALLLEACESIVVRTAWLFGAGGDCFPRKIIRAALQRKPLRVVSDQTGSPTYTSDLAAAVMQLADLGPDGGIYNIVNSGKATWHKLAAASVAAAGIDVEIEPVPSEDFPTAATRPKNSVLDTSKYQSLGLSPLPEWTDAVRRFAEELRTKNLLEV
ncbi:MAG: dTDP-4-dehydrorhamnose reductase [Fimbriimonadales bacterium]